MNVGEGGEGQDCGLILHWPVALVEGPAGIAGAREHFFHDSGRDAAQFGMFKCRFNHCVGLRVSTFQDHSYASDAATSLILLYYPFHWPSPFLKSWIAGIVRCRLRGPWISEFRRCDWYLCRLPRLFSRDS